MLHLPLASQVLQRREGYREIREMWEIFERARQSLFTSLQHAIDLRDIATLYEVCVFFRVVDELGKLLDRPPVIRLRASDEVGLEWEATAHFGEAGTLAYNRTFQGYSLRFRPDLA
jgi:predicted component of viral defense system (DUF524 family)